MKFEKCSLNIQFNLTKAAVEIKLKMNLEEFRRRQRKAKEDCEKLLFFVFSIHIE